MRIALACTLLALAATPAATAQPAPYPVDPAASTIVYHMSHPAHDWSGTSHHVGGTLLVEGARVVGGRVAAPVVSFDSGNRSRDSNMASDTEAYLYPEVAFEARSVQPGSGADAIVEGALTFHGVTRALSVPVTVESAGAKVHLRGHFEVKLTDFGIKPPSLMMVKTRDWVALDLDLMTAAR